MSACGPPPLPLVLLSRPQVPFWAKHRFHWTTFNVSTLLAFAGVILILIQTLGVRFLIPRFGEYRVLSVSVPLGIVQFALFGEWKACVCVCVCISVFVPVLVSVVFVLATGLEEKPGLCAAYCPDSHFLFMCTLRPLVCCVCVRTCVQGVDDVPHHSPDLPVVPGHTLRAGPHGEVHLQGQAREAAR